MKNILSFLTVVCLFVTSLAGCTFFSDTPTDHTFLQGRENVVKVEICTNSEAYTWRKGREVNSLQPLVELSSEEIDYFWNELLAAPALDISRSTKGKLCGDLLFVVSYANGEKELIGFFEIGVLNADGTFAGYRYHVLEDSAALAKLFAKYADPQLLQEVSMGFRARYK